MTDTRTKIAAGLERAFDSHGFAEPNIETLRASAGVSLRTLYRYTPSRDAMVYLALEHRHQRYMAHLFSDLPDTTHLVLDAIIDRIAQWMSSEASYGCLFHAAVAAAPQDARLRALLTRHKKDVTHCTLEATGLPGRDEEITVLIEGLVQSWPVLGPSAINGAKRLSAALIKTV